MLRKLLLGCGAISSALYLLTIDVGAALRYPDYHAYKSQMVSEMIAVGSPTRPLMIASGVAYHALIFAFSFGVWMSARGRQSVRLTSAALAGYGVMSVAGLFMFPMDVRGTVDSPRDVPHIVATFVMS